MTQTEIDIPELRRLRYFHGQHLSARDFQREQSYFQDKLRLRMRYLLGYGAVCGLFVEAGEDGDHDAASASASASEGTAEPTGRRRPAVRITAGLGVDVLGNEIVVRHRCEVSLWEVLPTEDRAGDAEPRTVWIGVEYDEKAVEPTRTVFTSECGDTSDCEYGWTRETFKVRVTARSPEPDLSCDTCGDPHGDGCGNGHGDGSAVLWLARIDDIDWRRPLRPSQINQAVRRPFGRRVPTVITGINWIHGHTYSVREAQDLLGTVDESRGLVVRFSDDIRTDCLRRGVVDIQVIEGGAGRNAESWFMGGEFADRPGTEFTREFRYRQTTRETLQDDDRVLITVRAAFLLDRCCRPVDGTHVGGKVPVIDPYRDPMAEPDHENEAGSADRDAGDARGAASHPGCRVPPSGIGPWTSGVGLGGDVFESWFFVKETR